MQITTTEVSSILLTLWQTRLNLININRYTYRYLFFLHNIDAVACFLHSFVFLIGTNVSSRGYMCLSSCIPFLVKETKAKRALLLSHCKQLQQNEAQLPYLINVHLSLGLFEVYKCLHYFSPPKCKQSNFKAINGLKKNYFYFLLLETTHLADTRVLVDITVFNVLRYVCRPRSRRYFLY